MTNDQNDPRQRVEDAFMDFLQATYKVNFIDMTPQGIAVARTEQQMLHTPPHPSSIRLGVTSCFEIACQHHLPYHKGKCARLHGHNYRIECTRYGTVKPGFEPDSGMVMDFADFDAPIKAVLEKLDHYSLNLFLDNPTAEHLALYLLEQLPLVDRIVVWETSKHYAVAERDRSNEKARAPRKRAGVNRADF